MTSETHQDEDRKRTLKIHRFIQTHKRKIGLLVSAGLLTTVLFIPPDYTSVSCHDPSIRRPYHSDTISVRLLLSVSLLLPLIMMTAIEWTYPPSAEASTFKESLKRSWCYTCDLFVGGLLMFFFNDLAKIASSEARPSFWSLCSPDVSEEQCEKQYVRISWKDCTNPLNVSPRRLADSMKSFPSGHASVSVYSSVIMMVYIGQRLRHTNYQLIALCVQVMWAVWAFTCCQSRIWDNKHHWWDVLVGACLGATGSYVTVKFFSNWFSREDMKTEQEEKLMENKL